MRDLEDRTVIVLHLLQFHQEKETSHRETETTLHVTRMHMTSCQKRNKTQKNTVR